jgi:hypothetical protein
MGEKASTEGIVGYTWWDAMEVSKIPCQSWFADVEAMRGRVPRVDAPIEASQVDQPCPAAMLHACLSHPD